MCTRKIISGIITWFYVYTKKIISGISSWFLINVAKSRDFLKAWAERARKAIKQAWKSPEIWSFVPRRQMPVLLLNHSINVRKCLFESLGRKPTWSKILCALICWEVFLHENTQPRLWRHDFFALRARCTRNYIIKKMFSSWMSASLHVRPVFSSSPTFKFLPCIASMIKKRKEKKIAELPYSL